jgi:hypothetical protein
MASVFISHQKTDRELAVYVSGVLFTKGILSYLDVFDPDLRIENLAERIQERIGANTHLMVVLSSSTRESWWVPFEIGIATEKDRPIANYFGENVIIPEYLKKWPYLYNRNDVEIYARLINSRNEDIVKAANFGLKRNSDQFNSALKKALGQ